MCKNCPSVSCRGSEEGTTTQGIILVSWAEFEFMVGVHGGSAVSALGDNVGT